MSTIKEKAEEYTSTIENQVSNNVAFLAYKSGANYVLNTIADVINQPMNDYLVLEELKKVILQLKK